ncbi:MAG: sporulation protein YtfJ [Firmicutes bacterium]|nr:sporulation protein YtfJ [Bacillota bacterium]
MQEKEYRENKINRVIETAMKNLSALVDVNTVIGKPMKTEDGSLIIPVSKVTLGFMTGGGEYGEVKVMKKDRAIPFAGGSGAIVSMKPTGFLVNDGKGYRVIAAANEPYEKILDVASDLLASAQQGD